MMKFFKPLIVLLLFSFSVVFFLLSRLWQDFAMTSHCHFERLKSIELVNLKPKSGFFGKLVFLSRQ